MTKLGLVIVSVAAVACGKGDKAGAAATPMDVAGVNALVPADLEDKLVFEETKIPEERGRHKTIYTVAAPKGWKQEMGGFASLKPPTDLGFMTRFEVGTNCDGTCEPKDWDKAIDHVYASYLSGKVIKNDKGPGKRTIVAEASNGDVLVLVAHWKDGDSRYAHCGGTLDAQIKGAAAAFEKACESVIVTEE